MPAVTAHAARPRLAQRWYAETAAQPAAAASAATKVTLTIATPIKTIFKAKEIDSIILPGLAGEFEVGANLVPVISELQPGVVTVSEGQDKKRFFVSGGFAFVHEDSTCNVNPVECVSIDDLDADAARAALNEATQKFSAATNEQEKAVAQVHIDTAEAVLRALGK